jgi:hypothetical protein
MEERMGLRSKSRNPWAVAPILAVILAIAWASVAAALECPEVIVYRVGDKSGFIGWTMHENEFEIDDFGGYRLWVREAWKGDEFTLAREYVLGEDNPQAAGYWHFPEFYEEELVGDVAGVRRDSADFFQNGFPYEFSATAFSASDPQAVNVECRDANRTGILFPRVGTRTDLDGIQCIPNPYRAAADWEYGGQRRVTFIGLPEYATIRIYTTSASHVRTLRHEDGESDLEYWDLTNEDGQEVAPGVYLWSIDAGELGTTAGKIMIIK